MANPVVVVGMHRSGTSLVSRILDDCGVMMGKDLQEDHESIFFISLNEWIYAVSYTHLTLPTSQYV